MGVSALFPLVIVVDFLFNDIYIERERVCGKVILFHSVVFLFYVNM